MIVGVGTNDLIYCLSHLKAAMAPGFEHFAELRKWKITKSCPKTSS